MPDLPTWALLLACHAGDCQAAMSPPWPCAPRALVAERLRGWRELPVWSGLTHDGSILELWAGADTWTIIETVPTVPERRSCYRSAGTGSAGPPLGAPISEER